MTLTQPTSVRWPQRSWRFWVLAATLLAALLMTPTALHAQGTGDAAQLPAATTPLCRFGVNVDYAEVGGKDVSDFNLAPLRAGWYIDYLAQSAPSRPGGIEYAPVIRLEQTSPTTYTYSPSGAALTAAIAANPGAAWMIGNEPDRRNSGGQRIQDEMAPALYATAYHQLYTLIKQQDPTARIFAGSIVQPTPLRLKYLDLVLQSYTQQFGKDMPVDGWSIHNFILNERSCAFYQNNEYICWGAEIPSGLDDTDGLVIVYDPDAPPNYGELPKTVSLDLFVEQIVRFRQWMFNRGYQHKPLYLTEYGVLFPEEFGFPVSTVNNFMNQTFQYLMTATDARIGYPPDGNRLVQRLSWYSTSDSGFNGYLFEQFGQGQPYVLTAMGQNYAAYTAGVSDQLDLQAVSMTFNPGAPLAATGATTVTITAQIGNSSNLLAATASVVRFYRGNPDAGGVLIGAAQPVQMRGCGATATASVVWPNVTPGIYPIYARVEPVSGEINTVNNTISSQYAFVSSLLNLPIIRR